MTRLPEKSGFTLVELMIVVVIVGILATVATASYRKYQQSARKSEAIAAINDIRMKQETFYTTYSRYQSSTTDTSVYDGEALFTAEDMGFYKWTVTCPDPDNAWCNLGFRAPVHQIGGDERAYFQFQTIGWSPGAAAPDFIKNPNQRWVTAAARGIPDSNGENCVILRVTNETRDVITLENENCK